MLTHTLGAGLIFTHPLTKIKKFRFQISSFFFINTHLDNNNHDILELLKFSLSHIVKYLIKEI